MTELADVLPERADGLSVRRARVIEVNGSSLLVDIAGGITVARLDSCNPIPGQHVYLISEGSSMTAIAAIGGPWRQDTLTVTADATNTVTGLLNGVSTVVTKMGAYTAAVGAVLPLIWSTAGAVWAGATPGAAYVPPPPGAPPTSGGGAGAVTTGTASYPATYSGTFNERWFPGVLLGGDLSGFFYGASRFRELQGRTILGFRAYLTRLSGAGSVSVFGNPQGGPGGAPSLSYNGGSVNPSGWVKLPIGLANFLISGSGTGSLAFNFAGTSLDGMPAGTLQFDWRK